MGLGESLEDTIENIKKKKTDEFNQLCIIEIDGKAVGELSYKIRGDTAYPDVKYAILITRTKDTVLKSILMLFEFLLRMKLSILNAE